MATEKQIAANRANAQKSTGPKTAHEVANVTFVQTSGAANITFNPEQDGGAAAGVRRTDRGGSCRVWVYCGRDRGPEAGQGGLTKPEPSGFSRLKRPQDRSETRHSQSKAVRDSDSVAAKPRPIAPVIPIDIVVQHFPRDAEKANTGGNILSP
jgi:hypothetical protein